MNIMIWFKVIKKLILIVVKNQGGWNTFNRHFYSQRARIKKRTCDFLYYIIYKDIFKLNNQEIFRIKSSLLLHLNCWLVLIISAKYSINTKFLTNFVKYYQRNYGIKWNEILPKIGIFGRLMGKIEGMTKNVQTTNNIYGHCDFYIHF
jgi:hypothetical protein